MRDDRARGAGPAGPADDPAWRLVLRALRELAGAERGVLYDVPRTQAPSRLGGTPVFLRGSPAWRTYLRAREAMDTGELTLLLALRPLDEAERPLVVDWGTTYANSFLLVEPRDAAFDLTDQPSAAWLACMDAARQWLHRRGPDDAPADPWTRGTPLGELLNEVYGLWYAWSAADEWRHRVAAPVALMPAGSRETLGALLRARLAEWYPAPAFEGTLAHLLEAEPELFNGHTVAGARAPFRTRLGLPVLHDPRYADRALRRLVNSGRAWVYRRGPDAVSFHGPARPVPDSMSDAEFETLVL